MAIKPRITPTIFDKLVSDTELPGLQDGAPGSNVTRDTMRQFSVPRLERFNEDALRATVRRELGWLLNTTNFASLVDLDPYPHVKTSVLNYGVPAMSGRSVTHRAILQRARDIRAALLNFEPRLAPGALSVEPSDNVERENSITFVIRGDVVSAVQALPVTLRTDVEIDSAAVTVRD